ncbi:putative membrane protein [Micavibrio aeruginosavorus ARL-13]|uniref:Putative membrane protein n=1 Tax=Micavibrio aeruginosavorus (strain ARL-13) TaxID=856793 RepID=G2KSP1_MICAA|nr:putative membrane protein [Micavibrio aeruginosavorus ARL-13]
MNENKKVTLFSGQHLALYSLCFCPLFGAFGCKSVILGGFDMRNA